MESIPEDYRKALQDVNTLGDQSHQNIKQKSIKGNVSNNTSETNGNENLIKSSIVSQK